MRIAEHPAHVLNGSEARKPIGIKQRRRFVEVTRTSLPTPPSIAAGIIPDSRANSERR
jgi:hypothetical protein